jgi:uncharacterized SAM-binding protein YcdF (DUF218 family)
MLKSIALILISPLKFAFICALIGLALSYFNKTKRAKFFYITAMTWLLVFSQPYVADLLLYPLEHMPILRAQTHPEFTKETKIVALACYFQTRGELPTESRWPECSIHRMLVAARLAKSNQAHMLVTGGNFLEDETVNYAENAAIFFRSQSVPEEHITVLGEGTTTREELQSVKQHAGETPLIIVTSATHRYRVLALAKELQLDVNVVAASFNSSGELTPYLSLPSGYALGAAENAFYEYLAILKYYLESM